MKQVLTIVGARPQFVKASVVSRCILSSGRDVMSEKILHTGQHYDAAMSEVFFRELRIPAPYKNLEIGSESHGRQTGRMIEAIEAEIQSLKPDLVLIYGDTNSTLAGALAAIKLHVPVAHVEAGMRSFNRRMPEEINRIVADQCSEILYTPSNAATQNLLREGYHCDKIFEVGDVMYDAFVLYGGLASKGEALLRRLKLYPGSYVLATIHRAENTDDPQRLTNLFTALSQVAKELSVIVPLHPRTVSVLRASGWWDSVNNGVQIIEPVGYFDMTQLISGAGVVATDSGGLQKEAYFASVPCVTLRDETEWVELVELGYNVVVPPTSGASSLAAAILSAAARRDRNFPRDLYGGGMAAQRIVQHLTQFLSS